MDPDGDPVDHPFQPPTRKRARASASSYVEAIASGSNGGTSPEVDPEVEHKRKKARERQRRKRERDRSMGQVNVANASLATMVGADGEVYDPSLVGGQEQTQQVVTQTPSGLVTPLGAPSQGGANLNHAASQVLVNMTPEEAARKEKIRSAARERQRKHRAGIKAKRMAEAGLAPMDMLHVHGVGGGSLTVAGPPDAYHHRYQEHIMAQAHHHGMEHVGPEPPFQHLPTPAQTFANTLLLSFSCTPLLKQHLLRTLNMSNDDLANLEPLLAAAWEAWDRQRQQMGYTHGEPSPHNHAPPFLPPHHPHTHPLPHQQVPPGAPPGPSEMHDFRTRFQRPLIPSPFGRAPNGAEYVRPAESEETGIDPSLSKPDGEDETEESPSAEPGAVLLDADFEDKEDDD